MRAVDLEPSFVSLIFFCFSKGIMMSVAGGRMTDAAALRKLERRFLESQGRRQKVPGLCARGAGWPCFAPKGRRARLLRAGGLFLLQLVDQIDQGVEPPPGSSMANSVYQSVLLQMFPGAAISRPNRQFWPDIRPKSRGEWNALSLRAVLLTAYRCNRLSCFARRPDWERWRSGVR